MVCLDSSERVETNSILRLLECGGRRLNTGGSACRRVVHRGLAERAEEDPVRIDLVDVFEGDGLGVSLSITVLNCVPELGRV